MGGDNDGHFFTLFNPTLTMNLLLVKGFQMIEATQQKLERTVLRLLLTIVVK